MDQNTIHILIERRNPKGLLRKITNSLSNIIQLLIFSAILATVILGLCQYKQQTRYIHDILRPWTSINLSSSKPFKILKINNEMETLAVEFIKAGAVPKNSIEDAYHIAIAVIYGMDYLLSWNFRHIVRLKTRDIVRMVISLKEYKPIEIIPPPELI